MGSEAFAPLLVQETFLPEAARKSRALLNELDPSQVRLLAYAGYLIDAFYLEPKHSPEAANHAARLAYVLIEYWEERQQAGDYLAGIALPIPLRLARISKPSRRHRASCARR